MRRPVVVFALTVVLALAYLAIVSGQPDSPGLISDLVLSLLIAPGLAFLAAPRVKRAALRGVVLGAGTGCLVATGLISAMSIGVFVLAVAVLALLVTERLLKDHRWGWLGAGAGIAVGIGIVGGFVVGQPYLPPTCPRGATASGSTTYPAGSLFSTREIAVSWRCDHGTLVDYSRSP